MKKVFLSVLTVGAVAVAAGFGTKAFFNDTEVSQDNTFTSGAIDLTVDSEAHYNGLKCVKTQEGYKWQKETENVVLEDSYMQSLLGEECMGTWMATDLGAEQSAFFNYADIKPGDMGENTISLHVENNDAYACAKISNMKDEEVGEMNEPEAEVDKTPNSGDLAKNLMFFAFKDVNGNNVYEPVVEEGELSPEGDMPLFTNTVGYAEDVLNGKVYPLATPENGNVIKGGTTNYIGLAWCAGTFNVNVLTGEMTCDGASMSNEAQTDMLTADIEFYVEQVRHNSDFNCDRMIREVNPSPSPEAQPV